MAVVLESLRPFLVSALAQHAPLLVVTATERECEELADELAGMYDDEVAQFPSWETLPHERLSPAADTVGRRLQVLGAVMAGRAPRVVVAAARSVVQPISPGAARRAPVQLAKGAEMDPTDLLAELAEFAYVREDLVARRGRGGAIVDVSTTPIIRCGSSSTATDRRDPSSRWRTSDRREGELEAATLYPCRELLLDDAVRTRAAELAAEHRANPTLAELLDSLAEGIPRDGMEALTSVLVPGEMATLPMLMPSGTRVVVCDPDKVRRRAGDLAAAGREFLEASWTAATMGGDAPVDSETLDLSGSGYRTFSAVREEAQAAGVSWWQLVPSGFLTDPEDGPTITVDAGDPPAPRGKDSEMEAMFARLRALVAGGGRAAVVVPGHGTVSRIAERLAEAEVPASAAAAGSEPAAGLVSIYEAVLHAGVLGGPARSAGPRTERTAGPRTPIPPAGEPATSSSSRDGPHRQPTRRHRTPQSPTLQAPQPGRPPGAQGRGPGGPRPARYRPLRRDGRAAGARRRRLLAARIPGDRVRARQTRRRRGPFVRAHGVPRPAQPLRRR